VRILIATYSRQLLGGVEKYLQSLIPNLQSRGHSVGLLYEYPSNAREEGIESEASNLSSWCSMELGVDTVLRSLQAWAPDVVYVHGLDDGALELSLLDAYPSALFAHTYYGTCVSGRKCHAWPRLEPCARQFGAACLALYYPRRCGGLNPQTMWQRFQIESKRNARLSSYQAVLVASRHMYREFQQNGVSADRLHLVPLPIEGNSAGAAAPQPKTLGYRLLFVGRLVDVKGISHLLRAMPLAAVRLERPLTLTIAGDGPERAQLEELARHLGLTVEFSGWVDNRRRADLMRQADLIVVPSLWPEPFGMVGVEAACFGVPAVGFAVGGIPDWLIPGQSGELAAGNPPTVEGLAEAIERAFADPIHYEKLRAGAWEMSKKFGLEAHLAQLESILAVGEHPGSATHDPNSARLEITDWARSKS
jgi:glycosyltransferase involved in cell wall biosynthesis